MPNPPTPKAVAKARETWNANKLSSNPQVMLDAFARALDAYAQVRERTTWEAATQIADAVGRRYAEQDDSGTAFPTAETCAAVACAVTIAAAIRAAAQGENETSTGGTT